MVAPPGHRGAVGRQAHELAQKDAGAAVAGGRGSAGSMRHDGGSESFLGSGVAAFTLVERTHVKEVLLSNG